MTQFGELLPFGWAAIALSRAWPSGSSFITASGGTGWKVCGPPPAICRWEDQLLRSSG